MGDSQESRPSGCAAIVGSGLLGFVCGPVLGLANGFVNTPDEVPGQPEANEWVTVGIFIFMFYEAVAGAFLGVLVATVLPTSTAKIRAFGLALAGAVLGLVSGWMMVRLSGGRDVGQNLILNGVLQFAGAGLGVLLAGATIRREEPSES